MSDPMTGRGRRRALNRFYLQDGGWYVEAREGLMGPFMRREDAVAHLARHKRLHRQCRDEEGGEDQASGESVA